MKALAVKQPYAFAIIHGGKDVENRSRPFSYRGPLLIHASKGELSDHVEDCLRLIAILRERRYVEVVADYLRVLALGAIVGQVDLVDCVTSSDSKWFQGPYGLVLDKPKWCEPFPYKGRLGLFSVPPISLRLYPEGAGMVQVRGLS